MIEHADSRPGPPPLDQRQSPWPAICVHSLAQARMALAVGLPVLLLSGPGAAGYAGCGWWRALIEAATAGAPPGSWQDLLDCGDAPGHALAALRAGQYGIVLEANGPTLAAVAAIAANLGATLVTARPRALDLARPGAARQLHDWLRHGA